MEGNYELTLQISAARILHNNNNSQINPPLKDCSMQFFKRSSLASTDFSIPYSCQLIKTDDVIKIPNTKEVYMISPYNVTTNLHLWAMFLH